MSEVLIGAADWQVRQWQDSYYPEDLPVEWRLGYYANEFTTTLLRYDAFRGQENTENLAEILEDCQEQFHPVIVVNLADESPLSAGEFTRWLDAIDSGMGLQRPAGVMLTGSGDRFDRAMLQGWRQRIPPELPVALDIDDSSSRLDDQWLYDNGLSLVWHQGRTSGRQGDYWLARIDLTDDAREVAAQIRVLASQLSTNRPSCLIAEKGYEEIGRLHELVTIIRLVIG